jgi:hypothetical protein
MYVWYQQLGECTIAKEIYNTEENYTKAEGIPKKTKALGQMI